MAGEEGEAGEETLSSLLEVSRTPDGRSRLAAAGTFATTLRRLPAPSSPLLLPFLRLLRNLCAGEIANQNSFLEFGGADVIASVLLTPPQPEPEILRTGLQVLGNVSLAGEEHRSSVWVRFFPAGFLEMARVREQGVCAPLCMALDTCCSSIGGRDRLDELCGSASGMEILVEIVNTSAQVGYKEEWLEWLLFKACVEEQRFASLFAKLDSSSNNSETSHRDELIPTQFNINHAFLLDVLSKCLTERPKEVIVSNSFALDMLKILKSASETADFTNRGNFPVPTGSPTIDVLGYSLLVLRDICAWVNPNSSDKPGPAELLLDSGLLDLILSLLSELEPPTIVRRSMEKQKETDSSLDKTSKKVCPFKGYRRDVVSVIANCLHRNKRVQEEVRQKKAIPLLLQQCVLDEENSYLREWGLLAVRNLLEGNEENQREVAELELQGPVDTPEISGLGLRVEVDKETRHAKLVNIPG